MIFDARTIIYKNASFESSFEIRLIVTIPIKRVIANRESDHVFGWSFVFTLAEAQFGLLDLGTFLFTIGPIYFVINGPTHITSPNNSRDLMNNLLICRRVKI